ncbi:MAG: hypothetical protein JWM17_3172 [Actinobacteria bacterium]|nr:hypothetical protein [Actinomycetota bacterium]
MERGRFFPLTVPLYRGNADQVAHQGQAAGGRFLLGVAPADQAPTRAGIGGRPAVSMLTRRARRVCGWCEGPIPPAARADAIYCTTRCRQASHRFGKGRALRVAAGHALRLAYADPPYPGKAGLYRGHPDFAGEVDPVALVERLAAEFSDGWALSTSARPCPSSWRRVRRRYGWPPGPSESGLRAQRVTFPPESPCGRETSWPIRLRRPGRHVSQTSESVAYLGCSIILLLSSLMMGLL